MTNAAKHTPAPWRTEADINPEGCTTLVMDSRQYTVIADCGQRPHTSCPYDECEANARLIAAAPDLLAALQHAEAAIRHLSNVAAIPSWKPELDRLGKEVRAVIARAEGASNG